MENGVDVLCVRVFVLARRILFERRGELPCSEVRHGSDVASAIDCAHAGSRTGSGSLLVKCSEQTSEPGVDQEIRCVSGRVERSVAASIQSCVKERWSGRSFAVFFDDPRSQEIVQSVFLAGKRMWNGKRAWWMAG